MIPALNGGLFVVYTTIRGVADKSGPKREIALFSRLPEATNSLRASPLAGLPQDWVRGNRLRGQRDSLHPMVAAIQDVNAVL